MLRALPLFLLFPALSWAQTDPEEWLLSQSFMPHQARLGLQVQSMTPELREYFSVPHDLGVLVNHVEPGKPAEDAGLKAGDVILQAGERSIRGPADFVLEAARAPAGDDLPLRVVRDKKERIVDVRPQGEPSPWLDPDYWREWLDKGVREGSRELRDRLNELEQRLEELERRFDEERREREGEMHRTSGRQEFGRQQSGRPRLCQRNLALREGMSDADQHRARSDP
jgi:hypothetical protein